MSRPSPTPSVSRRGVRTPYTGPGLSYCGACGAPLTTPRRGQKACSPRCRARLHRATRAAAQAARDGEVRRLLVAALRALDDGA
jgi:hypothetical protein